jgi:hypothetical protein
MGDHEVSVEEKVERELRVETARWGVTERRRRIVVEYVLDSIQ